MNKQPVVGLVVPVNPGGIGGTTVRRPDIAKLQRERDELLAALKALASESEATNLLYAHEFAIERPGWKPTALEAARALIAKVEGK